MLSRGDQKS